MDTVRILLLIALAFISLLIWDKWQATQTPTTELTKPVQPAPEINPQTSTGDAVTPPAASENDVPKLDAIPNATSDAPPPSLTKDAPPGGQRIRVFTDLLYVEIDTTGADIKVADLTTYPVTLSNPDRHFRLMEISPSRTLVSQSGLIPVSDVELPSHNSTYVADQDSYELADGSNQLDVVFRWSNDAAITVNKIYTFHRDSYKIDLRYEIENNSADTVTARAYTQLLRSRPAEQSSFSMMPRSFTGAAFFADDKFQKLDFEEMAESPLNQNTPAGWISFLQHYYVTAWVPPAEQTNYLYTKQRSNGRFSIGGASPNLMIAPDTTLSYAGYYFIGPKEQKRFEGLAEGLPLTVDYGWFTILSEPLFWILNWINNIVGNWGFSIILVTLLIKLVFFKLNDTSYRSMANMRRVQPEMQAMKERYANDKQAFNQAMMEFYKKEKINPLGGCLPILVQIPVFIALYWMLLESVEIRQAPFILWINDLSAKDPYFVLPVLMGVSMLVQQKLNPAPMEPIQQKVMMFLPIMFTAFFAFFPSGLVLYWLTNNVLSIAQQWYITRKIEQGSK